jgi:hypothetical protein
MLDVNKPDDPISLDFERTFKSYFFPLLVCNSEAININLLDIKSLSNATTAHAYVDVTNFDNISTTNNLI